MREKQAANESKDVLGWLCNSLQSRGRGIHARGFLVSQIRVESIAYF